MACQKVAAGGVIVLGQIADPVLEDGFGRGERGGDEGQARTRGRYVADQGARAAKMKSAPGPHELLRQLWRGGLVRFWVRYSRMEMPKSFRK